MRVGYSPCILSGIYQVFIILISTDACYTPYIDKQTASGKGKAMFYAIEYAYGRNVEKMATAPIGCWSLPRSACAMRGWRMAMSTRPTPATAKT